MPSTKNEMRVILAVDPFEPKLSPNQSSLTQLKSFLNRMNATVDVVYVLSNTPGINSLFDTATLADHTLKQYVNRLNLGPKATSHLIVEKSSSRKKAVDALLAYAKKGSAEMLILTAYGRSPLRRLVLGGFANLALAESALPLFFLNAKSRTRHATHRTLFPTDFSPGSKLAFNQYLEQFKNVKPEIILFHVCGTSVADYTGNSYNAYLPENFWQARTKEALEEGARWVQQAKKSGFKAKFILDENSYSVAKGIDKEAKKQQISMIALSSVGNRVLRRVFGNVAAQLFQPRAYPMWVCGPEAIKARFNAIEGKTPAPRNQQSRNQQTSTPFDDLWL